MSSPARAAASATFAVRLPAMSGAGHLAERAFRAAAYDFGRLLDSPGALLSRGDRQGVRILVPSTDALPDQALDAILAWRLGQYLLTGFYDQEVVAGQGLIREDRSGVHAGIRLLFENPKIPFLFPSLG